MKFDCASLPSRGIPYAVKEINLAKFRPLQMSMVSEAIYAKNDAPLIEAVGSVMDFDVNQLTDGDFYYFLTWLRFHSRDLPMVCPWECGGVYFIRKDNGEKHTIASLDALTEQWDAAEGTEAREHMEDPRTIPLEEHDCHHVNSRLVTFEDFGIKYMDETPLDDELEYPRVRHMVEYLGMLEENRYKKLAGPIRYIKEGNTLHSRLTAVLESPDMTLFDKAARAEHKYEHGIMQRIYKPCEFCEIDHAFDISIGASSFFMD